MAFHEQGPMMLGINSIVAQIGKHPRPETPVLLERLCLERSADVTLAATLVAVAADLPSGQMLRILDRIEARYAELKDEIAKRRAMILAVFDRIRARCRSSEPPVVDESVFEVAWEVLPGVDFIQSPPGTLDSSEWGACPDTIPVRLPAKSEFHVTVPRPGADRTRALLQLYSLHAGTAVVAVGSAPPISLPFGPGPNALPLEIPADSSRGGTTRLSVTITGPAPGQFGLRSVVLCPN
jgi:hypothetical protein